MSRPRPLPCPICGVALVRVKPWPGPVWRHPYDGEEHPCAMNVLRPEITQHQIPQWNLVCTLIAKGKRA